MPLDALVTGRIATLADKGPDGFGWVEAIGIRDGRVAFAGSEVDLETRADPHTERITLEPDQVAIPGLTDAHLHLAIAGIAAQNIDLHGSNSVEEGMALVRSAHERLSEPEAWLEGFGWDTDRWGRWPTADDLEAVAPGRRVALWAHDHHALLVSHAALRSGGVDRNAADPPGGVIRRNDDGSSPTGVLLEAAARLVSVHIPPPGQAEVEEGILAVGRDLLSLGVVACHDPGFVSPDPELGGSFPAYARLADSGRLPIRVHASLRDDALSAAIERGIRSGQPLGERPDSRARVGWLKLFADGSLGSRTAALLEDYEDEPDRPLPADRRRGVWMTEPLELEQLVQRAAAGGIVSQIHAIGDAAVRAALDVLERAGGSAAGGSAGGSAGAGMMRRIEHAQMIAPDDVHRFASAGIAASVQPVHLRTDAPGARRAWGERGEREAFAWTAIVADGGVLAFGTDAPVEPYDPWPGIAIAVARADASWGSEAAPFGAHEALSLERALRSACVDPAIAAGETDRGRLSVGQRADVVVLPAAALAEPVVPGGPLATVRPDLVLVDGEVVFER
jgi:predicted amidohydrolase YtcJ